MLLADDPFPDRTVHSAISILNPCFNVYHIADYCPLLYNLEVRNFNCLDIQAALAPQFAQGGDNTPMLTCFHLMETNHWVRLKMENCNV